VPTPASPAAQAAAPAITANPPAPGPDAAALAAGGGAPTDAQAGTNGASSDQTPAITDPLEALKQFSEGMSDEDRQQIADALLGKEWIVGKYAAEDIRRQAQSRSDRTEADNQLLIDKQGIDTEFMPNVQREIDGLGLTEGKTADALTNVLTTWQARHREAEFNHAVRRNPIFGQLTDEEHRRLLSVAKSSDAYRVALEVLLGAQDRVSREAGRTDGQAAASKDPQRYAALTGLVQALAATKGQTSSGAITSPAVGGNDAERLARLAGGTQTPDDETWYHQTYGRQRASRGA